MKDFLNIGLENVNESGENSDLLSGNVDEVVTEGADVNIPVPGGLSEKPAGVPADQNIPVPSKVEITSDAYNDALKNLQKTFKEGADLIEQLSNMIVVNESAEEKLMKDQNAYVENAIDSALMESFINGPIFEAVTREDKNEVKNITSKIKKEIKSALKEDGVTYYEPKKIIRIILGVVSGAAVGAGKSMAMGKTAAVGGAVLGGVNGGIKEFWSTRLWQILGVCHVESGNIGTITKNLTEKFKEDLGDYKILAVKTTPSIYDLFKTNFGWKNNKKAYFLLVDKKVPSEMKEFQTEVSKALEAAKKDDTEGTLKNESVLNEFIDTMYDLTESYVGYAYIEKVTKDDLGDMEKELADRKEQCAKICSEKGENDKVAKSLQNSINDLEEKIKKVKEEKED